MNDSSVRGRTVGAIGLGAMGMGMAGSLRRAGHRVHACDARARRRGRVRRRRRRRLRQPGRGRRRPAASSSQSSSTRRRPRRCCSARDGAAAAMAPGSVFVMCSTVDPRFSIGSKHACSRSACTISTRRSPAVRPGRLGRDHDDERRRAAAYARVRRRARGDGRRVYRLGDRAGTAARSRSSTSCSPACTSRPPPRRWRSACARASIRRRCTR